MWERKAIGAEGGEEFSGSGGLLACLLALKKKYIYIYIYRALFVSYIYAVELKTGPRFGVSSVKNWSKSSVKNWSKFFFAVFPKFYSVLGAFLETQIVQRCVKIVFLQNLGDVKNEVFEKKIAFFVFFPFLCWRPRNRKKKKKENGKAKKRYKNRFFFF